MSSASGNPWARSPFRWAGSKRQLVPFLLQVAPGNLQRYVEPFAGSCSLFFALRPKEALLGDINGNLMNAIEVMRAHPRLLIRAVGELPTDEDSYYDVRSRQPDTLSNLDQAVRFFYLNRYCFNGVYRINKKGQFNVPRGKKTGAPPCEAEIYRCSVALRSANLFTGDFEQCLSDVRKSDFVYLDPPYAKTGDPKFGEYGYDCFKARDVSRLAKTLRLIDSVGAKFILSYEDCSDIESIVNEWHCLRISVRRHVAGFGASRKQVSEVLVSNYKLRSHR